jgi:hypothetical protein
VEAALGNRETAIRHLEDLVARCAAGLPDRSACRAAERMLTDLGSPSADGGDG